MKFFAGLLSLVAVIVAAVFIARAVYAPPSLDGRTESTALPVSEDTMLGRELARRSASQSEPSAMVPLRAGSTALATRVLLADAAEASIDAQYYIWQNDVTGILLLDALRRAAERGVRVRLLVDDNGTPDLDPYLVALNALPTMEVRLYNPFVLRQPRVLSYLFDFSRLNRRMHNKSFTVDGAITVVGGRNIGDIYFARDSKVNYFDLDVVATGAAAAEVGTDFDGYWASGSAYPVDRIVDLHPDGLAVLDARVQELAQDEDAVIFANAIRETKIVDRFLSGELPVEWVPMDLVSDDPAKGLGPVPAEDLMIGRLAEILEQPTESLDLVSAYFVPGDLLTEILVKHAANGVRVRTLTNSQDATDVLPVHGGYIQYRDALLDGGVDVRELKSDVENRRIVDQLGLLGESASSLHAKTFTMDRNRTFIGSFNFDPRSALLNSEMGFLIHSPTLAADMVDGFDADVPEAAYKVERTLKGGTVWLEQMPDGQTIVHDTEPNTTAFGRFLVRLIGWLPVTWLL
ncbi:phospholipase D family protein [Oceanomicrobium pacificus]|uniref:Phospholipase D n=1 Tax=Oceanomicrobium pacificus TaxID=2692916 RepID=A0A6B0THR6_9RHOB|nr:phospholipase D family protein [Oceanomicrobium pacificus]MXU63930.1 phospholipase D family protein [Oceanomicrobium pacificus]